MRYSTFLVLVIILSTGARPAFAQDVRFRVELLLLRHLNSTAEVEPQRTLTDYSAALDLLQPPASEADPESASGDDANLESVTDDEAEGASAAPGKAGPEREPASEMPHDESSVQTEAEPQIVLLDTQSDIMQRAWRRLKTSADYRPELYLSWEQPEMAPFPAIRVHDQELLFEDDPYADLRNNIENAQEQVPTFTDTTTPVGTISGESEEAGPPADVLPAPNRFYRIDGTATLRKARFLHLDLNLEYREPLFNPDEPNVPVRAPEPQSEEKPRPTAYLVHYLRQSRQVQTQSMEYFDGPVFAVLALISRVEVEVEAEPDSAEPLASRNLP